MFIRFCLKTVPCGFNRQYRISSVFTPPAAGVLLRTLGLSRRKAEHLSIAMLM
jgi:hypothetical protein